MTTNAVPNRDDMTIALGRAIAAERIAKGWTQDELAERAGVHVNTLRRYELGQRDIPHTVTIAIAAAVGMRASELVRRSEERAGFEDPERPAGVVTGDPTP